MCKFVKDTSNFFVKDTSNSLFSLTLTFFQICSISAAPHCICIVYVGLDASGFSLAALRLDHSYLPNTKQRTKIMKAIVLGKKSYLEFQKDLILGIHFLIFLYVIFL